MTKILYFCLKKCKPCSCPPESKCIPSASGEDYQVRPSKGI